MESIVTTLSLYEPIERRFCPECGALMTEEDRLHENQTLFIWFRCSKSDCEAKWLSWKEGPGLVNAEMSRLGTRADFAERLQNGNPEVTA